MEVVQDTAEVVYAIVGRNRLGGLEYDKLAT